MMNNRAHELRIGNIVKYNNLPDSRNIYAIDPSDIVDAFLGDADFDPITLTLEILRDNFGFEISDMGDFWQCQKEDFVLIQMKLQILKDHDQPFIFVLKSSLKEAVTFTEVHHLQNLYLDLKGEPLEWK